MFPALPESRTIKHLSGFWWRHFAASTSTAFWSPCLHSVGLKPAPPPISRQGLGLVKVTSFQALWPRPDVCVVCGSGGVLQMSGWPCKLPAGQGQCPACQATLDLNMNWPHASVSKRALAAVRRSQQLYSRWRHTEVLQNSLGISVAWGCSNKISQTHDLKEQKCILSQVWKPSVQNQDVHRALFSREALGADPSLFHRWPPLASLTCRWNTPVSASSLLWCLPCARVFCVQISLCLKGHPLWAWSHPSSRVASS